VDGRVRLGVGAVALGPGPAVTAPRAIPRALVAVLAVAVLARIWGIHYGLPWLFYFHDEPQVVLRALRMGSGDLNPHFFIWPGTLLLYLALAAYAALYVAGFAAGWWRGKQAFAAAYFRDPSAFYLLARFESVALGTWTVWLAFALGRAAYSVPVGVAAAAGLALNAMHAHYSHLAHPVTAMTAFTVFGLWMALRVAKEGAPRDLYVGAIAAGIGMSAQYHAALLGVPLAIAVLYRALDPRPAGGARWLRHGLLAAGLAAATFLVLCPYVVLDFRTFRADLSWMAAKAEGRLAGVTQGIPEGIVAFYYRCLLPALHVPLAVAAALGAGLALVRRRRADVLLLAFAAAYVLAASRVSVLNDRYAIPLVPVAMLLVARGASELLARVRLGESAHAWAVPACVLALCLPSALELVETDLTMTRDDTRIEAKRWFESHAAPDDRVVIDMTRFWNSASPPLSENRARLEERLAEVGRGLAGAGHSAVYAEYYRFQLEHPRRPAYYLWSTAMGDSARSPAEYRRDGFRWAIVSEDAVHLQQARAARGDSSGLAYYLALEREAPLAAEFRPVRWLRRGPVIRVFRLDGSPATAP
jgi:hypothetical protein